MSYLPIILIVVFLLSNKNSINNLPFDLESITPLLSLFGVSPEITNALSSDAVKNVINGKLDINELLPLITSLISNLKQSPPATTTANNSVDNAEFFNPIKNVADDKIISTLGNYFQN